MSPGGIAGRPVLAAEFRCTAGKGLRESAPPSLPITLTYRKRGLRDGSVFCFVVPFVINVIINVTTKTSPPAAGRTVLRRGTGPRGAGGIQAGPAPAPGGAPRRR
ncbi:hypothetical protein GCM10023224_17250 [Streptomonospora halophila]|uniref:Uncharacterized protein n=1 Tax=Streptomonospora halophila TaxID=427369 RepID=A0ABP9GCG8_9ACTN